MAHDSYSIDCVAGLPVSAPASQAVQPQNRQAATPEKYHFVPKSESVYRERSHYELAETDRLNEAHWQNARFETPANSTLGMQLPTLRMRSLYESENNPVVEGLMLSHTLAVCGGTGPEVDLQGRDESTDQWCELAEDVWEAWCRHADAAGQMTLAAIVKQWNISCWRLGEFLEQYVTEDPAFIVPGIPHLRLHGIEPQRLMSPVDAYGDDSIVLGIKRSKYRRPLAYWLSNSYVDAHMGGRWYNARSIMHGYDLVQSERGQARGVPWMTTGLPLAADARDYDLQVLDAARSAADLNVIAYTDHPDAEYEEDVPASVEYRRRRINHLAPGWKAHQPSPAHPGASYTEHRRELHGDFGKGKAVPSAVTRLDGREHNYSSLRWDYQVLGESATHVRSTLYQPKLASLVRMVISEAILMGVLPPPPGPYDVEFVWPNLPDIDELKSAKAEELWMRIGTMTYSEACTTRHGRRARKQIRRRQRDDRLLVAHGLPTVAESTATGGAGPEEAEPKNGNPNEDASQVSDAGDDSES